MDDRYEEVPEKKSFGSVMKGIGKYFKNVFGSFIDGFKYNNMKLPAILVAIPGLLIGFFLVLHYNTISQLSFTFQQYNIKEFKVFTYYFPGVPFDATAISIFLIMLFGILNVFNALSMSGKKNLGSVVIATVFTALMILLSVYYVYCVLYYKSIAYETLEEAKAAGANAGVYIETAKNQFGEVDYIGKNVYQINAKLGDFTSSYIASITSVIVCDVISVVGVVLGFIYYDRTYEKVDR